VRALKCAHTKSMNPQQEMDRDRSRWLQAEFDRICDQFVFAKDAEHRQIALEKMHDVMAEMDAVVRPIIDPGVRPS
jgi:hypothetical protein